MERAEPTSTATAVTTARPTIRAAAVALVRLGLRMVFPRASVPTWAGSRVSGAPAAAASGPASSGPASVTPRKHSPAPMAVTATPAPVSSPASSGAAPAPVTASAAASRRAENPGAPGAASRSAWTGATRVARYAGASAAASATASPMTQASATPRSEEHTSELQSLRHLVCRLLLEKNNNIEQLVHIGSCPAEEERNDRASTLTGYAAGGEPALLGEIAAAQGGPR